MGPCFRRDDGEASNNAEALALLGQLIDLALRELAVGHDLGVGRRPREGGDPYAAAHREGTAHGSLLSQGRRGGFKQCRSACASRPADRSRAARACRRPRFGGWPSSPRRRGPIRRSSSRGHGAWVPAFAGTTGRLQTMPKRLRFSANWSISRCASLPSATIWGLAVVPANAGTHTPQPIERARRMGPCFRRDDDEASNNAEALALLGQLVDLALRELAVGHDLGVGRR